jgi:K+-transporting ATPase A subunit
MRRRATLTLLTSGLFVLVLQAAAFASDNGEGLAGETDDKVVTFFALGLVIFFAAFVILASALQGALEKRKQAKKASAMRHRTGW